MNNHEMKLFLKALESESYLTVEKVKLLMFDIMMGTYEEGEEA